MVVRQLVEKNPELLTVADVIGQMSPQGRRPPAPRTVHLWMTRGVLVNGKRVRLEASRVGRTFVTTRAAVRRFFGRIVRGVPA